MKDGPDTIRIRVRLTPKAGRTAIRDWERDANGERFLKICVTAAPEKDQANRAMIDLLSRTLGIPKSDVRILRGRTERNKILSLPACKQVIDFIN